ncbi:RNA polymerase ii subunit 7 [Erysiphe pulchra]|uniref:DNA-directed RNA polymerase subunit n=1 Tax=Erysiphe pulchra TaxID=225359 RepID=A0A2S4PYR2_9PEZI|nr:RNA polymerase ii subunit 7 [Erysiphe pulchra]
MDTFNISEGRILPGSGLAEFTVGYRAVVWRPFKGETVDAIVTSVNHVGFFADAGPLPLFVSAHLIPSDIKFDPNATPPQYTNNEDSVIEAGTHVRVKLIGTRAEVGGMYAIASIKEDYLGNNHEKWFRKVEIKAKSNGYFYVAEQSRENFDLIYREGGQNKPPLTKKFDVSKETGDVDDLKPKFEKNIKIFDQNSARFFSLVTDLVSDDDQAVFDEYDSAIEVWKHLRTKYGKTS